MALLTAKRSEFNPAFYVLYSNDRPWKVVHTSRLKVEYPDAKIVTAEDIIMCRRLKRLDHMYSTWQQSPLHHDKRCPIHSREEDREDGIHPMA